MPWFYWEKNEQPPNSSDLNLLDYPVGHNARMLSEVYTKTEHPNNIAELKTALLSIISIWNDFPQEFIDKAILSVQKRLRLCATAGGHFETRF